MWVGACLACSHASLTWGTADLLNHFRMVCSHWGVKSPFEFIFAYRCLRLWSWHCQTWGGHARGIKVPSRHLTMCCNLGITNDLVDVNGPAAALLKREITSFKSISKIHVFRSFVHNTFFFNHVIYFKLSEFDPWLSPFWLDGLKVFIEVRQKSLSLVYIFGGIY